MNIFGLLNKLAVTARLFKNWIGRIINHKTEKRGIENIAAVTLYSIIKL